MTKTMNRRAALGLLAALPAVSLPASVSAREADTLSSLITAHRIAWDAFSVAGCELEAAGPDYDKRFVGIGEREYILGLGHAEIAERIAAHVEEEAELLRRVDQWSPGSASPALAVLERERDAALSRLEAIFAPENAARERYAEASDAESDALMAICKHRCASPDELARKFRYLKDYDADLQPEHYDAIFDSFLPEAHSDEA